MSKPKNQLSLIKIFGVVLALLVGIPIAAVLSIGLVILFTFKLGRITDFQPVLNKQNLGNTPYFFEFRSKEIPAVRKFSESDTEIELKNKNNSSSTIIGSFSSASGWGNSWKYTLFSWKGKTFLIMSFPNEGSGGGNYYDVYNITTDSVPEHSLNYSPNVLMGLTSCVDPKLNDNKLEFTHQDHCDSFPLSFGGETHKNFTINLE